MAKMPIEHDQKRRPACNIFYAKIKARRAHDRVCPPRRDSQGHQPPPRCRALRMLPTRLGHDGQGAKNTMSGEITPTARRNSKRRERRCGKDQHDGRDHGAQRTTPTPRWKARRPGSPLRAMGEGVKGSSDSTMVVPGIPAVPRKSARRIAADIDRQHHRDALQRAPSRKVRAVSARSPMVTVKPVDRGGRRLARDGPRQHIGRAWPSVKNLRGPWS